MPQVTVTKMVEGAASLIVRVDLLNNDGSGELANYVILSPSDCDPTRPNNKPNFRVTQLWWGLSWFDVTFNFGSLQPQQIWTITRDTDNHVDFRSFGGITDTRTNPPSDEDGKILINTNGFNQLGAQGSFIMELRKTT